MTTMKHRGYRWECAYAAVISAFETKEGTDVRSMIDYMLNEGGRQT